MISLPPQIKSDLDSIDAVAKELRMKVYVVGGCPRDIVSGRGVDEDTDLDLTELNGNGFDLAFFVSAKYGLAEPVVYDSSGTALVVMPSGRQVEFHNAYHNVAHIIDQLYMLDVEPTPLNKDVYARDFTINTLLFDEETGEILDPTGKGESDIEEKILRTPLRADKSLAINPRIILRGIRFKLEMGLSEDPEYSRQVPRFAPLLIDFLRKHPDNRMVLRTVKKSLQADPERAMAEYTRLGLLPYLPKEAEMGDAIKEQMFGTTIHASSGMISTAQSKMVQRLVNEHEKHKAYMQRKRREDQEGKVEKLKILDRARDGYYLRNNEPDFVKDRKMDQRRRIFDYTRR